MRWKKELILGLFFIFLFLSFSQIKDLFYSVSLPALSFFNESKKLIFKKTKAIFYPLELVEENKILKRENLKLIKEIISLRENLKENKILAKIEKIKKEKKFDLISTELISKEDWSDKIFIDKGEKEGIREKNVVIAEMGVLVGKVEKVYPHFSIVVLITNPKIVFPAKFLKKEDKFLIRGGGRGNLKGEFIPKEAQIFPGEIIVSAPSKGIFPKNLLVGKVLKVFKNDLEPYQKLSIVPFFSLIDLQYLFVIKNF